MPDPVDVDGRAEVEVGLDGGGDLGEQRHPVFLVSAENFFFQARARSARARRACALRALGLLLADETTTVGGGKTF